MVQPPDQGDKEENQAQTGHPKGTGDDLVSFFFCMNIDGNINKEIIFSCFFFKFHQEMYSLDSSADTEDEGIGKKERKKKKKLMRKKRKKVGVAYISGTFSF